MTAEEILIAALRAPWYVPVRRRVLRQLIASLVYEGLLTPRKATEPPGPAEAPGPADPAGGDAADWVIGGRDASGGPVQYRFSMRRGYGFDRVRLTDAPVVRSVPRHGAASGDSPAYEDSQASGESPAYEDGPASGDSPASGDRHEVESLTRFLSEVADQLGAAPERVEGFARELEETLLKDAVAWYVRAERGQKLAGADYDTLEAAVADGHPYHPAYKSRIGFTAGDNLAWGPEFDTDVRPIWLAARGPAVTVGVTGEHTPDELLRRELGETYGGFTARIRAAGQDPSGYVLLPVHPWQWRTTVAHAHADALRSGDLIVVGTDPHAHRAQQSIRTLSNREVPQRASLKLALSLLNTSTSRTLAPHTVRNAPLITGWLRRVVDSDPYLREELRPVLLGEVMGVSVEPEPASEAARARTYGTLACIWREPLHGRLDPGERAIPYTGLIARELDGTPLIDPWVRAHGLTAWLRRLLTVSVLPLVHLLQRHGIGFESHAQNMILAYRDGMPTRIVLRDFHDGVRFSRAALARPELCPPLVAPPAYHTNRNSFLETDNPDEVADFLLDAFFFINLGEFALFLGEAYDLPEESFWGLVREVIADYQAARGGTPSYDIGKPRLDVEQLTARRLLPDTEPRVHSVPNPLCPEA